MKIRSPNWKPITVRLGEIGETHTAIRHLSLIHAGARYLLDIDHQVLHGSFAWQLIEYNPVVVVKQGKGYRVVSNHRTLEVARRHLGPYDEIEVRRLVAPREATIVQLALVELIRGMILALDRTNGVPEILANLSKDELEGIFRHADQNSIANLLRLHRTTAFHQKRKRMSSPVQDSKEHENLEERLEGEVD